MKANDAGSPVVVVLAAGRGARFKPGDAAPGHKLSQPFGRSTVLGSTLAAVVEAGLPLVVVTTSPLVDLAREVVAARDIVLLPPVGSNTREPLGVGYSISAGVSARAHAPGWLILPGDMPLVRPGTLRKVAQAMSHQPVASPVVFAQCHGRRGHPVGFAGELYTELVTLSGDEGARRLLARYPAEAVDTDDEGVFLDVDTHEDLTLARSRVQACNALAAASARPAA